MEAVKAFCTAGTEFVRTAMNAFGHIIPLSNIFSFYGKLIDNISPPLEL